MITNLLLIILAGTLGLLSHYFIRWNSGRTGSSLWEYLVGDFGSTLLSVITNVMACIAIFKSLPIDPSIIDIIEAGYAAYMSGYMFDSALNKDPSPTLPQYDKDEEGQYDYPDAKVQRSTGPDHKETVDNVDAVIDNAQLVLDAAEIIKKFTKK